MKEKKPFCSISGNLKLLLPVSFFSSDVKFAFWSDFSAPLLESILEGPSFSAVDAIASKKRSESVNVINKLLKILNFCFISLLVTLIKNKTHKNMAKFPP